MAEPFDRLKAALADRYSIERELGSGGMATVYLAEDCKRDPKLAAKLTRSEPLRSSVARPPRRFSEPTIRSEP